VKYDVKTKQLVDIRRRPQACVRMRLTNGEIWAGEMYAGRIVRFNPKPIAG
jgi:hypothetical protein